MRLLPKKASSSKSVDSSSSTKPSSDSSFSVTSSNPRKAKEKEPVGDSPQRPSPASINYSFHGDEAAPTRPQQPSRWSGWAPNRAHLDRNVSAASSSGDSSSLSTGTFEGYDELSCFAQSLGEEEEPTRSKFVNHDETGLRDGTSTSNVQRKTMHGSSGAITRATDRCSIGVGVATGTSVDDRRRTSARVKQRATPNDVGRQIHQSAAEHLKRGELPEALALFEEILHSQRKANGAEHKCVGAALHNVGIVHSKAQNYEGALSTLGEAVRVRKISLGCAHVDVASSLVKLGTVCLSLQDYDAADEAFREALRIRRTVLGGRHSENHPQISQVLSHVGQLRYECGELLSATSAFEEVLLKQRSWLSENRDDSRTNLAIAETLSNLGTIRSKRKQFGQAIVALEEAMKIQECYFWREHPTVLTTMDTLACTFSKDGKTEMALKVYNEILQTQISKHGLTHIDCTRTLSKMTPLHEKQNDFDRAQECRREIRAIKEQLFGRDHSEVINAQTIYDDVYCGR